MIIVRLLGGLGNQLFQYAAGKSLAMHHHTVVKLDINMLKTLGDRKFDLDYFHIPVERATEQEIRQLNTMPAWQKILPAYKRSVYKEPHFHFDPHFLKAKPDVYLSGFWQSEKYFKNIEPDIRREFTVRDEYIQDVKTLAAQMQAENSLFIHIRRSDYLKSKIVQDWHGLLDAGYYNKAIAYLSEKVQNIKVYFFSDDIEWVKENCTIDHPYELVTGKITQTAIEDFYLMSQCKHAIIANSSFSWWAAWLNNNPSKIVMAPKRWFLAAPHNARDIVPETWTLIP